MSKPHLIKLRNGVMFRLEDVRLIARKDLNQYNIVLEGMQAMPQADGNDVEFIESLCDISVAPEPKKIAAPLEEREPVTRLALTE